MSRTSASLCLLVSSIDCLSESIALLKASSPYSNFEIFELIDKSPEPSLLSSISSSAYTFRLVADILDKSGLEAVFMIV